MVFPYFKFIIQKGVKKIMVLLISGLTCAAAGLVLSGRVIYKSIKIVRERSDRK